jgi:hypothetical protein
MPHTTSVTYTGRQWLPMRVARLLVERYGFAEARRKAVRQGAKHQHRLKRGAITKHTPFLIIYWDLVALNTAKIPQPVRFLLPAESAA